MFRSLRIVIVFAFTICVLLFLVFCGAAGFFFSLLYRSSRSSSSSDSYYALIYCNGFLSHAMFSLAPFVQYTLVYLIRTAFFVRHASVLVYEFKVVNARTTGVSSVAFSRCLALVQSL